MIRLRWVARQALDGWLFLSEGGCLTEKKNNFGLDEARGMTSSGRMTLFVRGILFERQETYFWIRLGKGGGELWTDDSFR